MEADDRAARPDRAAGAARVDLVGHAGRGVYEQQTRVGEGRREPPDWSSLPDDRYHRTQLRQRLRDALSELAPIYRSPVVLRDVHGLSTEEASDALGLKPQTLKSRLHRGRVALRARLGDFDTGLSLHPAV